MLGYHCGVKARMEAASNKGGRVHRDSVPRMVRNVILSVGVGGLM